MKKSALLMIVFATLALTGCGKKEPKLKYGTYKTADGSTITLTEDNKVTVSGFDFSAIEKSKYEDFVIAKQNRDRDEKLTSEEEQKIRDKIDITKQFAEPNDFTAQIEEDPGCIGIYSPVNGCDLSFYAQYFPSDDTLVCEDKIFKLTEN